MFASMLSLEDLSSLSRAEDLGSAIFMNESRFLNLWTGDGGLYASFNWFRL